VISLGESWHNTHHSDPACARHGVDRGQIDLSAGLIRGFERAGWATGVRWPCPARLEQHKRRTCDLLGAAPAGSGVGAPAPGGPVAAGRISAGEPADLPASRRI
jgi:stearoyl-CoA desaturase (delta-9 desaturase)